MEDRESGSLSQKPALELLVELHRGSVTGSLKLERAPLQKAVYFRDGQILFAASNDPKDQLASILVEEGKLGPDQMQVAQARVSPGNPLAKVLTELGYISQRELADAARIKVEKILTDLYSWTEGTYQFATKSLPKGAIDLELSTARLLFASIRRVQDREWVLSQLGSLETVLSATDSMESFLAEIQADPLAAEVLRLVDGVKNIKQIGAVSSLGEFEVCKVLAAALVAGAVQKGSDPFALPASSEAFSFPTADSGFNPPPLEPPPSFGGATVGLPTSDPASQDSMSYDTIFQAAGSTASPASTAPTIPSEPSHEEESEKTVFEPAPVPGRSAGPSFSSGPEREIRGPMASELVIDEPEPDTSDDPRGRRPPRPKKMKGGGRAGGGGGSASGIIKGLGAAAVVGIAAFSLYYFVWPMVGGSGATSSTPPNMSGTTSTGQIAQTGVGQTSPTTTEGPATSPTTGATSSTPGAAATTTDPRASGATATTSAPRPVAPTPPPATTTAPRPTVPSGAPKPPPTTTASPAAGGGSGRALLGAGNLSAAARAFQQEIRASASDKYTIALGLYCNEDNAERMVATAGGSSNIYVLPTTIEGKSCYRVMWGLFDSREAAQKGMGSLPSGVRAGDSAPVAISRFLQ